MRIASILLLASCFQVFTQPVEVSLFRGKPDLAGNSPFEISYTPAVKWSFPAGSSTKSSPVISNGIIYFGDDKGTLFAVGPDGKLNWKSETASPLEAPPMVFGNEVIAGSFDGLLRAFNKTSGKALWRYKTDNQIAGSANAWISGQRSGLIFGSYDYYLHCVDPATGKLTWKIETSNYINGTPSLAGNRIVFGGCDGIIRSVDPLTGRVRDSVNIGVYIAASPAIEGTNAYFGDYDGTLYCVDLASKAVRWKTGSDESGTILGVPALTKKYVLIGREDKYMYCYNSSDGSLVWKFRTNGRISGSAVVTSTKVIFGSSDGYIYILNLADGKKIWSFNAGAPITSSPVVAKERFYILAGDGRLLAFGPK